MVRYYMRNNKHKEASGQIDVFANRKMKKWSRTEQVGRVFWAITQPFFALSPRPFWGWRRMLLRLFGAKVGTDVHIYPSVRIMMPWNLEIGAECGVGDRAILYALGAIKIGPRSTVSQGAHLCAGTHDISTVDRLLLKPQIIIGADAWIAADAFVGPGVTIGPKAIVGARAVVTKDIPPAHVVVGNPAKTIRILDK